MKRGGPLARRTRLESKALLRRYTELRRTSPLTWRACGEGGPAVPGIQPTRVRCASREPRATAHRLPAGVSAVVAGRSGGRCEIRYAGCGTRATQKHHRVTQKAGGRKGAAASRSDRPSNLIHACSWCHQVITGHPLRAYTYGLSLREGQEPTQEPVLYRGRLAYLDDAGGVHAYETAGA